MKLREPRSDCEQDRLAQRVAKLEEKLFSVMERNAELQEENARLHDQVLRLKQQLAAGRKDSSTSSKPPSAFPCGPGQTFAQCLPEGGKEEDRRWPTGAELPGFIGQLGDDLQTSGACLGGAA